MLRTSYWTLEPSSGPPSESLQKQLAVLAEEGSFRIDHQEATHVGEFAALDYRLESVDGSAYHSEGRLVLIGTQLVNVEVGGDALPSRDEIARFVNGLRVEGGEPPPVPRPSEPPSLPPLIAQVQASLLKMGVLQYQSIQESLSGDAMLRRIEVGTTRRDIKRMRDKQHDALVISEKSPTPRGKVENRFWLDAKTLLPYRWERTSPGASMKLEIIDGVLRGKTTGASAAEFTHPVGDTPLLFPGAPLEFALSTLPLARGLTGTVQVLDPAGLATGKPFSTWRLSVPFVGLITGLANLKQDVPGYRVELLEHTETEPRKTSLWIESDKAHRVLQVEALAPSSRGGGRSVQTLQARR